MDDISHPRLEREDGGKAGGVGVARMKEWW